MINRRKSKKHCTSLSLVLSNSFLHNVSIPDLDMYGYHTRYIFTVYSRLALLMNTIISNKKTSPDVQNGEVSRHS